MTDIESITWDAAVIGGGAAGLSAAQALGRSLRRTLVIDAGSPRNRFASHMHNVLGHDGVPPAELYARGLAEAEAYGVEFRGGVVRSVRDEGRAMSVELESGSRILARQLVVATGVTDALPPLPGLAEHWGSGVFHCPYCHGWEVRGQRIAVVALSPMGMHQAKLLRQWTERLTAFIAGAGEVDRDSLLALEARGVVVVPDPVIEIVGDGARVTAVRTSDGAEHAVDAVFTLGALLPHEGFLADLELERADNPVGNFIAVDPMGRTSHPRVWAVGNVSNPMASVPIAAAAGNFAGGAVNAALVEEDFALAVADAGAAAGGDPAQQHQHQHQQHGEAIEEPAEYWETRYADADRVWSGRVNSTLAESVADLPPGRSLDLGCGEGGDAIWLAERGWRAVGIDLSPTAAERGRAAAQDRGIPSDRVRFVAADLADWAADPAGVDGSAEPFDLITASFLQSPVELQREPILRAALTRLAPGGRLVLVAHAAPPPWSTWHGSEHAQFPSPESELEALGLERSGTADIEVLVAEVLTREATDPDGAPATLDDTLVVVRRR